MIEHDADFYGGTVNLASRISDAAGPGEVVVSGVVVDLVDGLAVQSLGTAILKGLEEPVPLFRLTMPESI